MRRFDFCTMTRSTGCSIPAGPASPASESAPAMGANSATSVIEIKSLRYISRDIISPRAARGRSVVDHPDRFTVSRRRLGDEAIAAAGLELGLHRETADRAALGHAAVDQQHAAARRQLDLARGQADFAAVHAADAKLHR